MANILVLTTSSLLLAQTGDIAHQLEYVSHHVRSKLDEIKRTELDRLRHYVSEQVSKQGCDNTRNSGTLVPRSTYYLALRVTRCSDIN